MRLETERLVLRPWEERDRAPFAAIVGDPETMRFYPNPRTRPEADAWFDGMRDGLASGTKWFLAAERKSDGALLGLIGTAEIPFVLPGNPRVEIGWVLGKAHWGQGYAPEGARAALAHAWAVFDVEEVVAFTSVLNTPSQRVMEKIGMTRDPADDFEHPRVPEGHRLRPHVLYRIANPNRQSSEGQGRH